jgi:hypothetical protein
MSKHTPGPWRWEFNAKHKSMQLCGGVPKYDLTVMDFVRWGMGGAAIRLRNPVDESLQVMRRCEAWAVPVTGREHHADWFMTIDHPDARLIASAPQLLEWVKAYRDRMSDDEGELAALLAYIDGASPRGRKDTP